jgi:uncharacterized SAM-binding protein YcdF (DUF218 family)
MTSEDMTSDQIVAITNFVDIESPPLNEQPTAHIIFGTNQIAPVAAIVAERYQRGLSPLIIATGGVNRHNGVIEGREFHRLLVESGVPDAAIRFEDRSLNSWQNVEYSLPFLFEAIDSGLPVTAVCKWYHRRAVHILKTLVPDIDGFHVITWNPVYGGQTVTRTAWPFIPEGRRRIVREWEEVPRRVCDGTFKDATIVEGAWR